MNISDIEKRYEHNVQRNRALRSHLERSSSSLRRERQELINEIQFNVQVGLTDEGSFG